MDNLGRATVTTRDYSFQSQMAMSHGAMGNQTIQTILLSNIPGAMAVERAQPSDDKQGTDYWVFRRDAKPLAVDLKARSEDPIDTYHQDDLALELWSVKGIKIGWTLDVKKQSDYILWVFQPTGRWVLLPFPMLCAVFLEHKESWSTQYKHGKQSSGGDSWQSECVFVPRLEVWNAICRRFGGSPSTY